MAFTLASFTTLDDLRKQEVYTPQRSGTPGADDRWRGQGPRLSVRCNAGSSDRACAMAATAPPCIPADPWRAGQALTLPAHHRREDEEVKGRAPQDWLKSIAPEIVRHVHEAPLFHLIYSGDGREEQVQTARRAVDEEVVTNPDNWETLRETILVDNPDAIVLVHRLSEDDLSKRYGDAVEGEMPLSGSPSSPMDPCGRGPNTWGLVVLGRHNRRHACYILQTTRVCSPSGATTHFSFTKAKCFGASIHQQLEQAWLA